MIRNAFIVIAFPCVLLFASACRSSVDSNQNNEQIKAALPTIQPTATPSPTPVFPNLQAELLNSRDKTTNSPIGKFDFKNYTYELPRGWQNPDGTTEITLVNGHLAPIEGTFNDEMSDEEKIEARSQRRIGLSHVTTKYFDATGDGEDEAAVILKVETGGSALPQLVYIFSWKDGKPMLIWPFRTGDRADGGLKDVRQENGELVVELYGQDRFLLGQTETRKITGDEEQLCCPTYYTRTFYKWNGSAFLMQRKRLTFSVADPSAPPVENLGEIVNKQQSSK
jgi:hypothetical protein